MTDRAARGTGVRSWRAIARGRAHWSRFVESVFVPSCVACGALGREPFCRLCTYALAPCGVFELEGIDLAWAALYYGGPVTDAIVNLKYEGRVALGRPLAALMTGGFVRIGGGDVLVPIPMERRRLRERGFNQAVELARAIDAPIVRGALTRRGGGQQVGRSADARLAAMRRVFAVPRPELVNDRVVVLVDDVVTTGATLRAAAEVLRAAGAREVRAVALARAERLEYRSD